MNEQTTIATTKTDDQDARRWWWMPAAGGAAAAAAIATIAVVPMVSASAIPVPDDGFAGYSEVGTTQQQVPADWTRPCFMVRPNWNDADGAQPRCPAPR